MTTLYLVRHASHGLLGRVLAGRQSKVSLSPDGVAQAARLASHFAARDIAAIHTSPRERASETAAPIAARLGLTAEPHTALDEIDFGDWTGRPFASLADDLAWSRWNAARATARPPGGESMGQAQARLLAHAEILRQALPNARLLLVSHADVIRAALLHWLGLSLDQFDRIEVAPASISEVDLWPGGARVVSVNERPTG